MGLATDLLRTGLDRQLPHSHLTSDLPWVMMMGQRVTTTISTKGQVILPKAIRDRLRWGTGMQLEVETTAEGVLLRAAPVFAPTRPDDVFASLHHDGPPKTVEEMETGILAEVRQRHARHRY